MFFKIHRTFLALFLLAVRLAGLEAAAQPEAATTCPAGEETAANHEHVTRDLNALHAFEVELDPRILKDVYADYEMDVKPHLGTNRSTPNFCLVTPYEPGTQTWNTGGEEAKSDIKWYSVNNLQTYQKYHAHVERLGLKQILQNKGWIKAGEATVYTIFLIVRQHSEENQMHVDWSEEIGTQVTTFLIPLSDFYIGMDYYNWEGEIEHYDYRLGKAMVVGGGNMHSTGIGHGKEEDVLLCVYIGRNNDEEIWDMALENIQDELEHYMSPFRGFVRNENLDGRPSKCQ